MPDTPSCRSICVVPELVAGSSVHQRALDTCTAFSLLALLPSAVTCKYRSFPCATWHTVPCPFPYCTTHVHTSLPLELGHPQALLYFGSLPWITLCTQGSCIYSFAPHIGQMGERHVFELNHLRLSMLAPCPAYKF